MGCNHFICNLPSQSGCILSFPSAWLLFSKQTHFFHVFPTNIVDEPPWAGPITSYTLSIKSLSSNWLMRFSKALCLINCREEVIQTGAVFFFLRHSFYGSREMETRILKDVLLSHAFCLTPLPQLFFSPSFFFFVEGKGRNCM